MGPTGLAGYFGICSMDGGYLGVPALILLSINGTFTCQKFDRLLAIHRKPCTYIHTVTQQREELARE